MTETEAWAAHLPQNEEIEPMNGSDNDLIRRGDAIARLQAKADANMLGPCGGAYLKAIFAIRAIPAVQVTVKPLEWFERSRGHWAAQSEVGVYYITEYTGMGNPFRLERPGFFNDTFHPTFEAAKAAAQSDYAARIRSALVAQPSPDLDALVEALENIVRQFGDIPNGHMAAEIARAALARVKEEAK